MANYKGAGLYALECFIALTAQKRKSLTEEQRNSLLARLYLCGRIGDIEKCRKRLHKLVEEIGGQETFERYLCYESKKRESQGG